MNPFVYCAYKLVVVRDVTLGLTYHPDDSKLWIVKQQQQQDAFVNIALNRWYLASKALCLCLLSFLFPQTEPFLARL